MRRTWGCLGAVIGLILIVVLVGILVIYSGLYNVSAVYPDNALVAWVLDTTMTHSVQHHAAGIKVPALTDPAMLRKGFRHYRGMCVACHGAPGVSIGDLGQGLSPAPPKLVEVVGDWKPNELFWLTKNGVRMTGMPAWGVTHTDDDIWAITAFLQKLPSMKPADYQKLNRQVPPGMDM